MRIVIDLQGAQASNARRGIGRYSLALAQGIARQAAGRHEVLIALNAAFADSIDPLRQAFAGLLPADALRLWHSPLTPGQVPGFGLRRAAERVREAFLASLAPDIVHVSSLFEGPGDGAVTSCGSFAAASARFATSVTLYDLIPLLRPESYLGDPGVRAEYLGRLEHLGRTDLLLAISESSRQEALGHLAHLGVTAQRCVNVSTAADAHFVPVQLPATQAQALLDRLGLQRPFVMYTGGIDARKNIEGLIRAFAALDAPVRDAHQLAIVCSVQPDSRAALLKLAAQQGLLPGQVVLTGFVAEDELVALYSLCKGFVFPSLHEGFGLPALEAMACGAAVIASRSSSVPEVVGRADALFDETSDAAIRTALQRLLTDEAWRAELQQHGLQQARRFSWDTTARRALEAFEAVHSARAVAATAAAPSPTRAPERRPRLAFVSPLPPERSGIADYSAELLPHLARHYDIDVVVAQDTISDPWVNGCCAVRSAAWFLANAHQYDRVLYHFGNSAFHEYMFELLRRVPGVVVLHDFFLSGIQSHREGLGFAAHALTRELMQGHGYAAVARRHASTDLTAVVYDYPCSFSVIRQAAGVIVHSPHSQVLARQWYGPHAAHDWALIPLLRQPAPGNRRTLARERLGVAADVFLVCSFGLLGPTKQNHRLVDAWLASTLAANPGCRLVFVGQNHPAGYGRDLARDAAGRGQGRIEITGWTSAQQFNDYLDAADLAVQLRSISRGETSAAVLDCMNHGVATIVNANGSMAYLPPDAVHLLPDEFDDTTLAAALQSLWTDTARRTALGARARAFVHREHDPAACAGAYAQAIERFSEQAGYARPGLLATIARTDNLRPADKAAVALAVSRTLPEQAPARQLLVDVSELVQKDWGSGIQRVVKSLLAHLLAHAPAGFHVEPVYALAGTSGYRYARKFTLGFLGCPADAFEDEPVDIRAGDIFLGLDLQPQRVPEQTAFFDHLRNAGARVYFVVYDLLPVLLPQHFVPGAQEGHERWLDAVVRSDGAICISQAVAHELSSWMDSRPGLHGARGGRPFEIGWFHLGAELPVGNSATAANAGLAGQSLGEAGLDMLDVRLRHNPCFLMVGTIEPRKGHAQTLAAFEQLWARGSDATLVMVGKPGWMVDALVKRLQGHVELGKRLFWLQRADDATLSALYARCSALIAASEGEGFGLPLVEAAHRGLRVIARDLPVFREVAGDSATYFSGLAPDALAETLQGWLQSGSDAAPAPAGAPLTWAQSAGQLTHVVLGGGWQSRWPRTP